MKRTIPFPGFSRGVPIIGDNGKAPEPPKGRYYYQIAVLIKSNDQPLDCESYEVYFPHQMTGADLKSIAPMIHASMKERAPDAPTPKVVPISTFFLGFVPQEALDEAEAKDAAAAETAARAKEN